MKRNIGQELIARMKHFNDSLGAIAQGGADSLGAICTPESYTTPNGGTVQGECTSGENRIVCDTKTAPRLD
jgi:hypothetical protein